MGLRTTHHHYDRSTHQNVSAKREPTSSLFDETKHFILAGPYWVTGHTPKPCLGLRISSIQHYSKSQSADYDPWLKAGDECSEGCNTFKRVGQPNRMVWTVSAGIEMHPVLRDTPLREADSGIHDWRSWLRHTRLQELTQAQLTAATLANPV